MIEIKRYNVVVSDIFVRKGEKIPIYIFIADETGKPYVLESNYQYRFMIVRNIGSDEAPLLDISEFEVDSSRGCVSFIFDLSTEENKNKFPVGTYYAQFEVREVVENEVRKVLLSEIIFVNVLPSVLK
jgi:hypothetical protein